MVNLHDYIKPAKNASGFVSFPCNISGRSLVLAVTVVWIIFASEHCAACLIVALTTTEFSRFGCVHLEFFAAPLAFLRVGFSSVCARCLATADDSGALLGTKLQSWPFCLGLSPLKVFTTPATSKRDVLHFPILSLIRASIFPVASHGAKHAPGISCMVKFISAVLARFKHISPRSMIARIIMHSITMRAVTQYRAWVQL